MIEIVPYKKEHAYMILEGNINDFDMQLSRLPGWETWSKQWEKSGPGYTMFADAEIIGCAGISLLEYNTGQCWMIVSTKISKYKKTVFKEVKIKLSEIQKKYKLLRIQTLVLPDFKAGKNFAEHLGFEREGLLRKFGPNNEDFLIYARIY